VSLTLSSPAADLFRPLGPAKNRTGEVVERLAAEIAGGRLAPGARLPTEQEMTAALGVSRTVIREAVAMLRAEGLVETRQGVGAFVVRDVQRRPFRIDPDELRTISEVVQVMELRTGVEVEAAGIAAERISGAARGRIAKALGAIDVALGRGEAAIDEDFAFHQAIAQATGNPHFMRFLEFLGHFLIPRQSVRGALKTEKDRQAYLQLIQSEHRAIAEAIGAGNVTAARRAMRKHLQGSRERYRKLAADGERALIAPSAPRHRRRVPFSSAQGVRSAS
jgi:GntR family transcriptional regulator, transcriptional repressor for pyruvate dehydrogenase complex